MATETKQKPATPEEGYALIKNLLFDQVYKFSRSYGGDVDDLTGEAHIAFMKGHEQFIGGVRPSGATIDCEYHTHIRRWVWYTMFDAMRQRLKCKSRVDMVSMGEQEFESVNNEFNAEEFESLLTGDGRVVARLAIEPPRDLLDVAMAKGGSPRNFRSTIRQYLVDSGWAPARITAAFEEIKEVL